jgi:glycosyltransferase involved in cell wall biosynthesis
MGIAASQRMMLYCMDPAWCPEDRGGLDLIAAFDRAGLAQAGWRLILQVEAGCLTSSMERRLAAACDRVQGVRLVQCVRRRDFMRVLLAAADVYASPHAGTGFGLTLARAMARGLTVVATDFGGSRDYLDASCGYPVPVTLHRQGGDRQYPAASPVYARADVAELAGILLRAASRAAAADGGPEDTGRARIAERYSAGAVAVALRDAVTAVLES